MGISQQEARRCIELAHKNVFGKFPSVRAAQVVQGIAWLETQFGAGWKRDGVGSNNMGAVQGGHPPCNPAKSFLYTDTHPNPNGTSTTYEICFKKYPDAVAGFQDVDRLIYQQMSGVFEAAESGDLHAVSEALYKAHYYEGFGATPAQRIANHYRALRSAVNRTAAALGEQMPDGADPLVRVMKFKWIFPMRGDDVRRVQRALGFKPKDVDGWFGRKTRDAVKNFQSSIAGLTVDGVVGLDTWFTIQEKEKAT